MLTGNQSLINYFPRSLLAALAGMCVQVLRLYQKANLVNLGQVALNGTKLKTNASQQKAMSHKGVLKSEQHLEGEMRAQLRKELQINSSPTNFERGFNTPRSALLPQLQSRLRSPCPDELDQ